MTDKPTPTAAVRALIEAAKAFLEKTDAVFSSPSLLGVISVAEIHHCPYIGPTLNGEDLALGKALAALPDLSTHVLVPRALVDLAAHDLEGAAADGDYESHTAAKLREFLK